MLGSNLDLSDLVLDILHCYRSNSHVGSAVSYAKAVHKLFVKVSDLQVHWNWWVFVKCEPKSSQLK